MWLTDNNVAFEENMLKVELLDLPKKVLNEKTIGLTR
jgi:hypothetical protein